MPFKSPLPHLDLPQANILTHLFGNGYNLSTQPVWIDAKDTRNSLSPHQLVQWIRRLGYGLERLGVKRGDVVMMCSPNHIFVPVAYLGIVGSGAIFSGASPMFTVPELTYQLQNTSAKVVLAHPSMLDTAVAAAEKAGIPKNRIFQFSGHENPVKDGILDWRTMIGTLEQSYDWQWPILTPEEAPKTIATINFSSGTTGFPKGVCIAHTALIANLEQSICVKKNFSPPVSDQLPPERWLGCLPLYHAFGQLYACLMVTKLLIPMYIMEKFHFTDFLETIQTHKVTHLQVAPPVLVMLSKRPETPRYNLKSLRHILCGAAPLSRDLQDVCKKMFNVTIAQGYGMTELTCGGITMPEAICTKEGASGSVGYLLSNLEAKLLDDDGHEVKPGDSGDLYIKGPNVCLGYWRNEKATKESFTSDGFFQTGDVAKYNEDGWFWIVDRKKELIKVNGLQVAPAELEAVLLENEHIADAAVVQVKFDEDEYPRAYVVLQDASKGKLTPKDVQDWIATRVAKHKRLVGGVVFIDEVPKLPSGKIMRKVMRELSKRDAEEMKKNGQVPVRAKL